MPGTAGTTTPGSQTNFEIIGGGSAVTNAVTGYEINLGTPAQPVVMQGIDKELFNRYPKSNPLVRIFESLPKGPDGWDDYWRWQEDVLLTENALLAGSVAVAGTTLTLDNVAQFTPRDILMIAGTYRAQVVSVNQTTNQVVIGYIGTAPVGVLAANSPVVKIGSAYEEDDVPNVGPIVRLGEFWNAWQTMLVGYQFTHKFENNTFRFGAEDQRQINKADRQFDTERCKTYIWGDRSLTYLDTRNSLSTMRGLWKNAGWIEDIGGNQLQLSDLQDFVQGWATGDTMEGSRYMCHVSTNVQRQIDAMFYGKATITSPAGDTVPKEWGVQANAFKICGVTINFILDPMMDLHGWNDILVGYNLGPGRIERINFKGHTKHNNVWQMPYGLNDFRSGGHIMSCETLKVKWSDKTVRCMENIADLSANIGATVGL